MGFSHKININENDIFGDLTVLKELSERNKQGLIKYLCQCKCGNQIEIEGSYLKNRRTTHCGCKLKENQSKAKRKTNKYIFYDNDNYVVGYTSNTNKEFYIDLEDYNKIKDYCWLEHDGYIHTRARFNNKNKDIRLHRFIMGLTNDGSQHHIKVDHKNHNTFDNRKKNLRITTNQENCFNHRTHKNNTSGHSGISFRKDTNKWRVRLWINNGQCVNLGSFTEYDEALKVRKEAEEKYFGDFRYKEEEDYE